MAKLTRKELLKQDDAFLAAASQSAKWVVSHRAQVILASVATVVVVAGAWGTIEYTRYRTESAAKLFDAASDLLDAQVVGESGAEPSATPPTFATDEAKWKAAKAAFDATVDAAGMHGAGVLAAFYSADLSAKLGDTAAATSEFDHLLKALDIGDSLYFLAVERAAYLKEASGDKQGAIATWQRLLTGESAFYADHAAYEQARLYIDLGEPAKARPLLESFESTYASSALRAKATEALAQLGPTEAAAPTPQATTP